MNDGQRHRRRNVNPNLRMGGDDHKTGNPSLLLRKPRKPRVQQQQRHQHQQQRQQYSNKPRPKYTTSWKFQLLLGLCMCLANGLLIVYFGWIWYHSKAGMKLPTLLLLLQEEQEQEIFHVSNHHYHKVEKMWRHDRNQFHRLNMTAQGDSSGPPPPIMVVGLPKAGTSTLFEFFSCHSIYAQHWYCCGPQRSADLPGSGGPRFGPSYMSHCLLENLQEQARQQKHKEKENGAEAFDAKWNHSILDGCGDYDVYTEMNGPYFDPPMIPVMGTGYTIKEEQEEQEEKDEDPFHSSKGIFLPQHYHLQELHAAAPTATWILNVRPVQDWIRSVANVPARSLVERLQYEVLVRHATENKATGKYQQYQNLWTDHQSGNEKAKAKRKRFGFGLGGGGGGDGGGASLRGEKTNNNTGTFTIPRWQQEQGFLRDFWDDHIQRVQNFAQAHGHRLILVNISDAKAGVQLGLDLEWWGPRAGGPPPPSAEGNKKSSDHHHQQQQQQQPMEKKNTSTRVVVIKPKRATASKAKACWKQYNVGEYH
ncbi:MAG: hypothetical protein SGBAC_013246 [Bacillariaceae sp.]